MNCIQRIRYAANGSELVAVSCGPMEPDVLLIVQQPGRVKEMPLCQLNFAVAAPVMACPPDTGVDHARSEAILRECFPGTQHILLCRWRSRTCDDTGLLQDQGWQDSAELRRMSPS